MYAVIKAIFKLAVFTFAAEDTYTALAKKVVL